MGAAKKQDLKLFPGGDLVDAGLKDLRNQVRSEEALLVLIARPRLVRLGFEVPDLPGVNRPYEHRLYEAIENRMPRGAHAAYNALIQRIVSFANCYRP